MSQMQFSFDGEDLARKKVSADLSTTSTLIGRAGILHPPTPRELILTKVPPETLQRVSSSFGLTPTSRLAQLVAAMVLRRGWDSPENLALFSAGASYLPAPELLKNFSQAVSRITQAIKDATPTVVVGDYDVDGITSVSEFGALLQKTGTPHTLIIPHRQRDGFGISTSITDRILLGHPETEKPYGLVILLDHGSQAHEHITRLREKLIDVVVIDHHTVHHDLPDALVINPRQPGCGWASQYPCAEALSHSVTTGVSRRLGLPLPDYALAAIGTISDMVPFTTSSLCNRIVARQGLADLRRTENIGVRALACALKIPRDPHNPDQFLFTSSDIAFLVGPTLNATGRLADANMCVELLTTSDPVRAAEIARNLVRMNEDRKALEGEMLMIALERLSSLDQLPDALVHFDSSHHLGINGLLAQRLAQRWGRPAFVFAPNGNSIAVGSGRAGHERYDVFEMLDTAHKLCLAPPSPFVRFGGHRPAGGATIAVSRFSEAATLINEACRQQYQTPLRSIPVPADCVMRLSELTPLLFDQCEALLEPFGNQFPGPQILVKGVRVERIQPPRNIGGRYRLTLVQGSTRLEALLGSELWSSEIDHDVSLDVVASPVKLFRNQERFIQLSISGYTVTRRSSPSTAIPAASQPEVLANSSQSSEAPEMPPHYTIPNAVPPKNLPAMEATSTRHSDRVQRSVQPKKLKEKLTALRDAQSQFDRRYLYADLEALEPDHFNPKPQEFYSPVWQKLRDDYKLTFDDTGLQMRPEAIEFIRYFFDKGGSHILQAATGSGKTKIALIIASHFVAAGHRAVFVAPTREIAQQVYAELPLLFGPNVSRLLLAGGSPAVRRKQLAEFKGGFLVGTAATVRNDIKNALVSLCSEDLLIDDECHHATGKDSSVSILKHAKDTGARRLLLSATPWQIKKGESAASISRLQELAGTNQIFPLNRAPNSNSRLVQFCKLSPPMQAADSLLREAMKTYRDQLVVCADTRIRQTATALQNCLAPETPTALRILTTETLNGLRNRRGILELIRPRTTDEIRNKDQLVNLLDIRKAIQRTLTQRDEEYVSLNSIRSLTTSIASGLGYKAQEYWLARGAMELTYLHRILVNEGIVQFMLRVLEKRCGVLFPRPLGRGEKPSAWGEHITELYVGNRADFVSLAYRAVSPGNSGSLWQDASLEDLFGTSRAAWNALSKQDRIKAFRNGLSAVKKAALLACEDPQFFSHPGDEFILSDTQQHGRDSFIWVEKVEQVKWLAQHMNRQLGKHSGRVVGLTGAGRPGQSGMSSQERDRALAAFRNDPDVRVIIGTTTLNEGIDAPGHTGYDRSLKGSFIQSTQKAGRPGRREQRGEMITICTTNQQYRTLLSNVGKTIENQKILNALRAEILSDVGLPPLTAGGDPLPNAPHPTQAAEPQTAYRQEWLF
jgi:single-stranded-DNA-specific exonuclease